MPIKTGLVIRLQAGFYFVQTDAGLFMCNLRGKFKRGAAVEDIVAVGDHVTLRVISPNTGVIEQIHERKRAFIRKASGSRSEYKQILIANPDQLVLVFSCTEPTPRLRMLDRFLVISEKEDIPPLIVVNKIDLMALEEAKELFCMYPPIGYDVLFTSSKTGQGLDDLHERLMGKISVFAGPSGVGKSSLLNAIQPQLGLAVGKISSLTSKGRHTTVVRELFPLKEGGYVADMPGIRSLSLWDTQPEELDGYFPELRSLITGCRFNDCTHQMEPGCAVIKAVQEGQVHPQRYESYVRLRTGEEEVDY
ncbi:MAG: ribosome small subunit-dependent GTPase A [Chloroflexi bacterium]|nr:ribosome small subunit-dependent GTPase A [Chloroflexota bacterium]